MLAAIIVIFLFAAVCYAVDKTKQRCPALRWVLGHGKYSIQYETVFGLWMPYRGGGAFRTQKEAELWIESEISRLEGDIKETIGPVRRPLERQ